MELNDDERALLTHITRWGRDGYHIKKIGNKWTWEYRSLKLPILVKTKREAVERFEAFEAILLDKKAGRL